MGKEATRKRQRQHGVTLEEGEARQLLAAQRNLARAQLAAREAIDLINAKVRAAAQAQQAAFDSVTKKYGLDPTQRYSLDDETLRLTLVEAS